jgi:hypothetical protein
MLISKMHRWLEGRPLEPFRNRCVVTKIFVARFVMGTVERGALLTVSDNSVKSGTEASVFEAQFDALLLQQITMALAF